MEQGYVPRLAAKEFEDFIVDVADHKLKRYHKYRELLSKGIADAEVKFISHFLRSNFRKSDKRTYTVTFRDLKRILGRFNCDLVDQAHNFIDVIQTSEVRRGLPLFRKVELIDRRVMQVAFPGWGREVPQNTVVAIRRATGLTSENGYDSQVFFHDVDDLETLVADYQEPLRSLAYR